MKYKKLSNEILAIYSPGTGGVWGKDRNDCEGITEILTNEVISNHGGHCENAIYVSYNDHSINKFVKNYRNENKWIFAKLVQKTDVKESPSTEDTFPNPIQVAKNHPSPSRG